MDDDHTASLSTASAEPSDPGVAERPFFKRIFAALARPATSRFRNDEHEPQHAIKLCHVLLSERGEISASHLAAEILSAYRTLDPAARETFFELLASEFLPNSEEVAQAVNYYLSHSSPAALRRLQEAVESPRQELFRRLNLAPGATATIIEMRRHLLRSLDAHHERAGIDGDLIHLLRSWFNGGFLVLRRIDWRTSAVVLERLIQFEAVHQIQGWSDLRRRLEADRRCYAFFHPALQDDPLIFIEVALTRGMSAKVQPLLDPSSAVLEPGKANCAIFYSITNCQEGLRGISFGNLLIKQVVQDLKRRFPQLRTFATLSPIPGFRKWLMATVNALDQGQRPDLEALLKKTEASEFSALNTPHLRSQLVSLCAYYLLQAKQGPAPRDSVARFHLANGARLDRLNWLGDTSMTGIERSFGLMANYVYSFSELERNHEAYAREYKVAATRHVERMAKECSLVASLSRQASLGEGEQR